MPLLYLYFTHFYREKIFLFPLILNHVILCVSRWGMAVEILRIRKLCGWGGMRPGRIGRDGYPHQSTGRSLNFHRILGIRSNLMRPGAYPPSSAGPLLWGGSSYTVRDAWSLQDTVFCRFALHRHWLFGGFFWQ